MTLILPRQDADLPASIHPGSNCGVVSEIRRVQSP